MTTNRYIAKDISECNTNKNTINLSDYNCIPEESNAVANFVQYIY